MKVCVLYILIFNKLNMKISCTVQKFVNKVQIDFFFYQKL